MNTTMTLGGVCLAQDQALALDAFAVACGADADPVRQLVDEGLLQPASVEPEWRFGGEVLGRVRRIRRLQRDVEASLQWVAVMLDLWDEIDRLRAVMQRAGITALRPRRLRVRNLDRPGALRLATGLHALSGGVRC